MKQTFMQKLIDTAVRKRLRILVILIAVVLAFTIQSLTLSTIAKAKRESRIRDAYLYGENVADTIVLTLENSLEASASLKYFYKVYGEDCYKKFDQIAAEIAADHPMIASMYLAPKGVITMAYPEEVNAATIGFEMLKDPEQGPRAQLAIETKAVTLAGPHLLIEGGEGFIIRNPVFVDGRFSGFTVIVLNWEAFVDQIMRNTVGNDQYKFGLWKDSIDEQVETDADGFFFRNTQEPISKNLDIVFEVPNDVWHLAIEPRDGLISGKEMQGPIIISIVIIGFAFAFGAAVLLSEDRRKRLQNQILENETRDKYTEQLKEALDRAKRAEAAKGSFLSRIAHDIRTPLSGIIGLMEIMAKHAGDRSVVEENCRKGTEAANQLLSRVGDLMELQRIEEDDIQLAYEPFDLQEVCREVLSAAELEALEKGISISSASILQLDTPWVYGSAAHLKQILRHILQNAVRFNKPQGSIVYSFETVPGTMQPVSFKVMITDTGVGMTQEQLSRVFDAFSQLPGRSGNGQNGSGIGLAIVKKLIDKMGGDISIISKPDMGTTVTLTIPFDPAPENAEAGAGTQIVSIEGIRVLLVEDNELNMEIARMLLEDLGAVVTEAHNGREAVRTFTGSETGSFDVILMDLMMPEMDGYEAAMTIRSVNRPDAKTIPVYAMTANAFTGDVRRCMESGMNGYMSKPIDTAVLLKILAGVMKGRL